MNISTFLSHFFNQPAKPRVDFILKSVIVFYLLILWVLFTGSNIGDFGNYYYGSYFLQTGNFNLSTYNPTVFNQMVAQNTHSPFFLNYTPVPPFSSIIYYPFSYLPFVWAKYVWNLFTLVFFIFSIFKLAQQVKLNTGILLLLLMLLYIPIKTNFYLGQSYLLLIALLTQGYLAYENGKKIWAVLFWTPAILLKIFPAIVILFLFKSKDFKSILLLILFMGILIGGSCFFIPYSVWIHYAVDILPRLMAGEINDPYALTYQSADVFFRKLFVKDVILNPTSLYNNEWLYGIILLLFKTVVIFILFNLHKIKTTFHWFAFIMLGGMLLSGYGSLYGYLQLIFIFILVLQLKPLKMSLAVIVALCIIFSLPILRDSHWPLMLEFIKLYTLILFFVLLGLRYFKYQHQSLMFIIPVVGVWLGLLVLKYNTPNKELSPVNSPPLSLLTIDLKLEGNQLNAYYWTETGIKSTCIKSINNPTGVKMVDDKEYGQVFIINDTSYFLTDYNRGVGMNAPFYTVGEME